MYMFLVLLFSFVLYMHNIDRTHISTHNTVFSQSHGVDRFHACPTTHLFVRVQIRFTSTNDIFEYKYDIRLTTNKINEYKYDIRVQIEYTNTNMIYEYKYNVRVQIRDRE